MYFRHVFCWSLNNMPMSRNASFSHTTKQKCKQDKQKSYHNRDKNVLSKLHALFLMDKVMSVVMMNVEIVIFRKSFSQGSVKYWCEERRQAVFIERLSIQCRNASALVSAGRRWSVRLSSINCWRVVCEQIFIELLVRKYHGLVLVC